jgi:L-asparaginase
VDAQSRDKGVMLAMNSHINAARDVTKTQTSSVETFKSSEFGFLGVVDFDRIVYARTPLRRQHIPIKRGAMPYVEIVAMYGGADGHLVKAAIDHGAEGIVPRARLGKCELADVHCDQGGNCQGYVGRYHFASSQWTRAAQLRLRGGGKTLVEAGAVMGDDLSPQKARILLMLLLQSGAMRSKDLQAAFDRWFDSRAEAAGRRPATAGSA